MIKRIEFLTRRDGLNQAEFHARLLDACSRGALAASSGAPKRATVCLVLHEAAGCDVRHDAINIEWFDDATAAQHQQLPPAAAGLLEPGASVCIFAQELVLRGTDWLEQRWSERTTKYKHMALARRAAGLSAREFSERWRNRPGQIGGAGGAPAVTIPAAARGLAYIQNHPLEALTSDPRYDAINEVYFDDLSSMCERSKFFANHDVRTADADLIRETHFAIVREIVIA